MKKFRLNVDALQVQSFATDAAAHERGTVQAHDAASGQSCPYECTRDEPTCNGAACRTFPLLTCLC